MMRTCRPWLACLLLILVAGVAWARQETKAAAPAIGGTPGRSPGSKPGGKPAGKPEEAAGFGESVTVNVVNVDVFVTDKKSGNRVTGLGKKDFELYEDGKPMAITNFYAVEGGKLAAVSGEPPAVAPAGAAPGPQLDRLPVPEDQKLRLVVYIDNFNLRPFHRNKVMRALRVFLDQKLRRDDQAMLITYDRSLHVRHGFTSDSSLINSEMLALEKISAQGVHQDSDRRETLRNIDESKSAAEAEAYARAYAGSAFNDLQFTIDALKDVVTMLAGMPGRKAVVYVSDGLPMIAGQDIYYAIQNKYREQSTSLTQTMEFDGSRRFEELAATANANRVTFYTIDAAGLRVFSSTTAENRGTGAGTDVYVDSIEMSNLQSPLQMLAEKTGGVAILNTNEVGPRLDRIAQDFSSFYSLGYSPPHSGDGRLHRLQVKVKHKGWEVRVREGYRDKSPESRMNDSTLAALHFPFESNPLGISLEFGRATPRDDGYFVVPVNVRIPLGKLVLVPGEKTHDARVRLFIAAMDSDGGESEVQQTPVPIKIPAADAGKIGGKSFVYTVSLLMRSGDQKVAIGLRDDVAAQESFVTGGLRVQAR
ncbi:MAG TPA: VWA domain-containing protein [Thermoanaerobaculia bacterium]|nr:VWA domain-containing protein [Thermoanaerobaculia bacterium]